MSETRVRTEMLSVRVSKEEADELRMWSERTGKSVGAILREGMRYPLERQRALWLEEHRDDPDAWEIVPGPARLVTPRKLDAAFSCRLTGEQMRDMLPAAEACGLPLSSFMREAGLREAASMTEGGSARCHHMSLSGVTSAECGECGPLPVGYVVMRQAS
jgi:hypothetical protein